PGWLATPPARPAPGAPALLAGESWKRSGPPPTHPAGSERPARSRRTVSCLGPPPSGGRTGCGFQAEIRPCSCLSRKAGPVARPSLPRAERNYDAQVVGRPRTRSEAFVGARDVEARYDLGLRDITAQPRRLASK